MCQALSRSDCCVWHGCTLAHSPPERLLSYCWLAQGVCVCVGVELVQKHPNIRSKWNILGASLPHSCLAWLNDLVSADLMQDTNLTLQLHCCSDQCLPTWGPWTPKGPWCSCMVSVRRRFFFLNSTSLNKRKPSKLL